LMNACQSINSQVIQTIRYWPRADFFSSKVKKCIKATQLKKKLKQEPRGTAA